MKPFIYLLSLIFIFCACQEQKEINLNQFRKQFTNDNRDYSKKNIKRAFKNIGKVNINKSQIREIKLNTARRLIENGKVIQKLNMIDQKFQNEICYTDTIFCNDTIYKETFIKCYNPGPLAHSVTGGMELGTLNFFGARKDPNNTISCSSEINCFPISDALDYIFTNVNLAIQIPCTEVNTNISMKMMLFGGGQLTIDNFYGEYTGSQNSITLGTSYDPNTIEINVPDNSYNCGQGCFVRMNLNFQFNPNLINGNICDPYNHYIAFYLDYNDNIVHSDGDTNHEHEPSNQGIQIDAADLMAKISTSGNNMNSLKNMLSTQKILVSTNLTEENYCDNNPQNLIDFFNLDQNTDCGHRNDHTLILKFPFCTDKTQDLYNDINF